MHPHELLGAELGMLVNMIKRRTNLPPDHCLEGEVTRTHGLIIGYLMERGGSAMQRDIEEEYAIRRSTVSRVLKLMEQKGLITREYLPHDARQKRIVLTDRARAAFGEIMTCITDVEQRMVAGIAPGEIAQFRSVLQRMLDNLRDNPKH